ncbi:MAG: hypothetical protein AAGF95_13185 [Chloroflexota bacterium]
MPRSFDGGGDGGFHPPLQVMYLSGGVSSTSLMLKRDRRGVAQKLVERRGYFAGGLAGAVLPPSTSSGTAGTKGLVPFGGVWGTAPTKTKGIIRIQDMEMQRYKFVEKVETYMYCYAMDEARSGVGRHA